MSVKASAYAPRTLSQLITESLAYTCKHGYFYLHVNTHTHEHTHTLTQTHTYTNIHTHTLTHTHTNIHTHTLRITNESSTLSGKASTRSSQRPLAAFKRSHGQFQQASILFSGETVKKKVTRVRITNEGQRSDSGTSAKRVTYELVVSSMNS